MQKHTHFLWLTALLVVASLLFVKPASAQSYYYISYGDLHYQYLDNSNGDNWSFYGYAGDVINITMESEQLDSYLEVSDPFGDTICSDDDSGSGVNARISSCVLRQTGDYIIHASDYYGLEGSYYLELLTEGNSDCGTEGWTLGYGESIFGETYCPEGTQWFFNGTASDVVSANMRSSSFDTYLESIAPAAYSSARTMIACPAAPMPASSIAHSRVLGLYTLVAKGYSGATGSYSLTLDQRIVRACQRPPCQRRAHRCTLG